MKKNAILVIAFIFLAAACSKESKGNIQVYLKDAPLAIEKILVTISQITVHQTGGANVLVSQEEKRIDLIQLKSRQEYIAVADLDPGKYTEIRLVINTGSVVDSGVTYSLTIPSSEIKIPVQFDILKEQTTKIILDFDAENSIEIHPLGGGQNEYILRPVVNVDSVSY